MLGEPQEKTKRIAVGGDGVRARSALALQPLGEEGLEKAGEERHGRTFHERSSRTVAASSSAGTAVRYQYVVEGPRWPR